MARMLTCTQRSTLLAAGALLCLLASPALAENASLPTYVNTPNGPMHTENTYMPGVTHAELGWFAGQSRNGRRSECLKAQSIAARTYVLRHLNRRGRTAQIPALNGVFQAWSSRFSTHSKNASQAVRGQVMQYQTLGIYSNYSSGAWPLNSRGFPDAPSRYGFPSSYTWTYIRDQYIARKRGRISSSTFRSRVTRHSSWAWTYILNTDNAGKRGGQVEGTLHASSGDRNRGGLGQYRAYWFDKELGYGYQRILRSFYGEDITIVGAPNQGAQPTPSTPTPSSSTPSAPAPSTGSGPDLVASAVSLDNRSGGEEFVGVGHDVRLSCTVTNQGSAFSSSAWVRVGYYVNGTRVAWGQKFVRLGAGERVTIGTDSGQYRPGAPGAVSVEARVDDANAVSVRNESNNRRSVQVAVAQPIEITAGALNCRSGASTGYRKVGLVRRGQRYVARERRGDWYRIDLRGGVSAWCHGGHVRATSGTGVVIRAGSMNVRTGPSASYRRVGSATRGQLFLQSRNTGGWSQIGFNGQTAWVAATRASYAERTSF
jgi:uncharacterized protein YraI